MITKDFLSHLPDYLVYGAIALVTLIGIFKCLLPLMGTTRSLRRAIHRLQQDAGTRSGTPVWQEKTFMGVRLKGSWLRFLQNAEQLDRRGLPCNVEDYINDDTVTHGPGNAQLAEMIPSLLTSLGILGTFIGMTAGIAGIDMSNAENIMNGTQTLLEGMKTAFGTSVAGVSCSILFNMINRTLQGSSYRAIDDFTECFTSLAMSRPLDNDVQLICQNQDSNHMLSSLTDVLPGTLATVMEGSVSRAMQPVAQAMDNFLMGATRAQIDGVAHIVGNFVQHMNNSLNDQFIQLGRTMTEINQNQQLTMDHVLQSMEAANVIIADVQQLHTVSQDVLARFEQYVQELASARTRDERFEQSSSALLEKMYQMNAAQEQMLQQVSDSHYALLGTINDFAAASAQAVDGVRAASQNDAEHLHQISSSMRIASQELSGSCQNFVQNVVGGLSEALGAFDQNMTAMITALNEKIDRIPQDGVSGETASQTAELQRLMTQLQETLTSAPEQPGKEG